MGYDDYTALKFSAIALAQNAKAGSFDPLDLADLITRAEQLVGSSDPLFKALSAFSSECDMAAQGRGDLVQAGRDLFHAVDVLNMPEPPDLGRRDIHG